ncbi:MAG: hypothetical protein AAGD14_19560 [Planctomycetota bacterium]
MFGVRFNTSEKFRNLEKATTPWYRAGSRKAVGRAADDPLRHVRLRARKRRFRRDASNSRRVSPVLIVLFTAVAWLIGYYFARSHDYGRAGELLLPFVTTAVGAALFTRIPLGAKLLILVFGMGFIGWPLLV